MAELTRKSEKTIATVAASNRKVTVNVVEKLTIEESKQLRGLLKAQEKVAAAQTGSVFSFDFPPLRF